MSKTILVVGGAGYIGSAVVQLLVDGGHRVTVFDNLSTGQKEKVNQSADFIQGDILNLDVVKSVFLQNKFDAVIHLAAKKAVGESELDPAKYFQTNVTGTINLLTAMAEYQVPQIIFSSTAAVYAPPDNSPVTELSPTGPLSVYGKTKLIAEETIKEFARTGKIERYTILRYFNVAGDIGLNFKELDAQNVFPILAKALEDNSLFNIYGTDYETRDGTCVRDYIHLADLAEAHVLCLDVQDSDIYNLGTGEGNTVKELVKVFEEVGGRKINAIDAPARAGDVASVTASANKAKQKLNWQPKKNLRDMVQTTLNL